MRVRLGVRHKSGSGEFVSAERTMADSWVIVGQRGTVHRRSPIACVFPGV